jgi:hypothetical protein
MRTFGGQKQRMKPRQMPDTNDFMAKELADDKEDILKVADRHESVSAMEPLLIGEHSRHRGLLTDLAVDLAAKSAGFRRSLPPGILTALADLVRSMNCYYSNLIEGHDTHPIDIERALKNDYSADRRSAVFSSKPRRT